MSRNRKAVISASGIIVKFYVDGEEWRGTPASLSHPGEWLVAAPCGTVGHGHSLWDAVGDANRSRGVQ